MANRTVKYAASVHGVNPQYLIEKIVRERIYDAKYWQQDCFLLTSALVLERAVDDLKYIGGTYGAKIDPTPFLCLVLKLLQIQPEKEIVYLYIDQSDFKYLRALGAFYLRLTGKAVEVYTKLEPLYKDYRKLRVMDNQRRFSVLHMDEFIDSLLHDEKVFNITVPRITKRHVLEDNRDLEPYKSPLEELDLIPAQQLEASEEQEKSLPDTKGRLEGDRHERSGHHRDERDDRRFKGRPHESSSSRHRSDHRSGGSHRDRDEDYHHHHPHHHRRHSSREHRRHDSREYRRRSRSRTPPPPAVKNEEKQIMSKYSNARGRFSQAEIDNENAIRAKVGLKPLH